ncbi:hypothetical protein K7H09_23750 [Halomonas sp. IOP_14]|uniref:hypothetical protein n=1 Tax=Halomonas sp. IOP_14 TaxID=2873295 RepID=UPI001E57D454|nr:hypothetical protein [Halomonas sp. IOP_14]MCD1589018.1 hypothetical protein [Halomonas sp. IOP_14]
MSVRSICCDKDISFLQKYSHGVFGLNIDERSEYSIQHVADNSLLSLVFTYDKNDLNVNVNGSVVECHELSLYLSELNVLSLLIDSTSLDVPELALILNAVKECEIKDVLIVYFEPENYSSSDSGSLNAEEFNLSDEILGFEGAGIPTISMPLEEDRIRKFIAFAGFEAGRLQSAIETYDISSSEAKIFFGIPAFRPGWEMKSIRRNIHTLSEHSFGGRIGYCSANNVTDALRSLYRIKFEEDAMFYLLPLGTKPNSIAAIIFKIENDERVRILYDQPQKKVGRSQGVGRRHYYHYRIGQ